jgi:CrcB protein
MVLALGVAGGLGALARVELSNWVGRNMVNKGLSGSLVVNSLGSLAAGVVAAAHLSPGVADTAAIGFLGGFTTFSTWMVETVTATDSPGPRRRTSQLVSWNLMSMILAGLAGAALGSALITSG